MSNDQSLLATLASLERDHAETKLREQALQTAITALRAIVSPEVSSGAARGESIAVARPVEIDPRLRNATMLDAATIALEIAQRPLRVREIFETITAMGYSYPKGFEVFKGSMTPTLDRHHRFTKVSPGLYALASSGPARAAEETSNLALRA